MNFLCLVCITLPASRSLLPLLQQVYRIGLPLWSPCSGQRLPENGTEWICDASKLEALANWSFQQRPSMCKAEATTTRLGTIRPACRRFLCCLMAASDLLVNFVLFRLWNFLTFRSLPILPTDHLGNLWRHHKLPLHMASPPWVQLHLQ